uniref:Carbohydrate sulfotransferase n=1 Tax=Oncorhynchus tshawytscha TaxID=74940 RepID=A0AAZ3Q2X8_ONCTS
MALPLQSPDLIEMIWDELDRTQVQSPDQEYLIKCRGEEMYSNPSFLIPSPRQPPLLQWPPHPVTPTSGDPAESPRSLVTKRHRKLLLKSGSLTPSGTLTGEEYHRLQGMAQTQVSSRHLLREVCSKYQPGVTEHPVSCLQVFRVFVEDRHCNYSGSFNLQYMSLQCTAHNDANQLRRLDSYDHAGVAERLCSYTKVLFVWEPLEGLVSAFHDKFESSNWYYHSAFGRPIISRYRANASLSALRTDDGVTFREFVQYLLDVSQLCSPCLLHYDFIGKFPNFLLQSIGCLPTSRQKGLLPPLLRCTLNSMDRQGL